jgi:hypothetical protein
MSRRALTALALGAYRLALRARLQRRRGAGWLERPLRIVAAAAARDRAPR